MGLWCNIWWCVFFLLLLLSVVAYANEFPASELQALQDLFDSTGGNDWSWLSANSTRTIPWNFTVIDGVQPNPCSSSAPWQGVFCSSTCAKLPCSVVQLELQDCNLVGSLPSSLQQLTTLTALNLSNNGISGSIPVSLFELTTLTSVDLSGNFIFGHVESAWSNLTALTHLNLGNNYLFGTIPSTMGSLTSLTSLNLAANYFFGSIPAQLSQLKKLKLLDLSTSKFDNTIPAGLFNLTALIQLHLGGNLLNGTIPSLAVLPNLHVLGLQYNQLSGTLPSSIANMTALTTLYLTSNSIKGSIPNSICTLTDLQTMELDHNQFTGSIPECISSWPELRSLIVSYNRFHGPIPISWSQTMQVTEVMLNNNLLTGELPSSLLSLDSLQQLWIGFNMLTGQLPTVLNRSSLLGFTARNNFFSRSLPSLLSFSEFLDVQSNLLTGHLPEFQTSVNNKSLTSCLFSNNFFIGTLPESLFNSSLLYGLDVSNNELTGSIPNLFRFSSFLEGFSADNNFLSSTLPDTLCRCRLLQQLSLEFNFLSGPLFFPCINGSFARLQLLQLSSNFLVGALPIGLIRHRLKVLYLSDNQLSGSLSKDAFAHSRALNVLSLAINCFTGSLPNSLCVSQNLIQVTLSGLHSAHVCERRIFAWSSSGILMNSEVHGIVPACLFRNESRLQQLQLAGNALTGTIPDDIVNSNFSVLSLSNNMLTGTVPRYLWSGLVEELDLSFNRFRDVIPADAYARGTPNGSLSMEVNRLSGQIPDGVQLLNTINLLDGNLFGCSANRDDLPVNDPHRASYSCGSSTTNVTLMAVGGAIMVSVCVMLLLSFRGYRALEWVWHNSNAFLLAMQELHAGGGPWSSPLLRANQLLTLSRSVSKVVIVIALLFVPLLVGLKQVYATVNVTYIWVVSTSWISGVVPAVSMGVVFVMTLAMISKRLPLLSRAWWVDTLHAGKAVQDSKEQSHDDYAGYVHWPTILFVGIYVAVSVLTNALYIYIATDTSISYSLKEISSLLMSLFKLLWTSFLNQCEATTGSLSGNMGIRISLTSVTVLSIVCNVLLPLLVQAFVNSNCFLYAIQAASPVSFSFPSIDCQPQLSCQTTCFFRYYCSKAINKELFQIEDVPVTKLQFVPSYQYSYQCSSSLVAIFTPVFVYRILIMIVLRKWLPGVLRSWNSVSPQALTFAMRRMLPSVFQLSLASDFDRFLAIEKRALVQLVSNLITNVAIMLSFGLLFPPLAFLYAVWIVLDTYLYQALVGNLCSNALTKVWLIRQVTCDGSRPFDVEVDESSGLVHQATCGLWVCLMLASAFWAWALFDTLGDSRGISSALGVFFAMVMSSMLMLVWRTAKGRHTPDVTDRSTDKLVSESDVREQELPQLPIKERAGVQRDEEQAVVVVNPLNETSIP